MRAKQKRSAAEGRAGQSVEKRNSPFSVKKGKEKDVKNEVKRNSLNVFI